ncbi:MAG: hypothetical protein H0X46_06035, partial [Bacteroidetes bacterium]|nr:hypothetical protein [Bacteroidota bacterium]
MKKLFILLLVSMLSGKLSSQSWDWKTEWRPDSIESIYGYGKRVLIHSDAGNYYVLQSSYYSSDSSASYIISFSASGDSLWKQYYPLQIDQIRANAAGELFVRASLRDTVELNGTAVYPDGYNDGIMLHLDALGNIIAFRNFPGLTQLGGFCFDGSDLVLSGTYWGETIIDGDTLYDNISANAFLLRTNASFYTIGSFTTDCTTCYAGQVEKGDDGNIVFRVNMSGLLYFSDSTLWGNSGNALLKISPTFNAIDQVQLSGAYENYFCRFLIDKENNIVMHEWFHWTSSGTGNSVRKLDPAFNFIWYSSYLGNPLVNINSEMSFDLDEQDNIYFTGFGYNYYATVVQAYVGKFNKWGMLQWLLCDSTNGAR